MLQGYFKALYQRTMQNAYALARNELARAMVSGGELLDCGAHDGRTYDFLQKRIGLRPDAYHGIEWNPELAAVARGKNLDVIQGDLNKALPYPDGTFRCVVALSVLEHLFNPCHFLGECHRVLERGGTLVILTPNISTYFTALLILLGKMPSSGPHPDSDALLQRESVLKVSRDTIQPDAESDIPVHRHVIVFSYRVLKSYLEMLGFSEVRGHGFGLYPFPIFMQPVLEKIDPWHCHQMVFIARK